MNLYLQEIELTPDRLGLIGLLSPNVEPTYEDSLKVLRTSLAALFFSLERPQF